MSNYRPKDWKKGIKLNSKNTYTTADLNLMYESGADAMLGVLSKQNATLPDVIYHYTIGKLGKLVFIPDEE